VRPRASLGDGSLAHGGDDRFHLVHRGHDLLVGALLVLLGRHDDEKKREKKPFEGGGSSGVPSTDDEIDASC
jgi:hypothetical protein